MCNHCATSHRKQRSIAKKIERGLEETYQRKVVSDGRACQESSLGFLAACEGLALSPEIEPPAHLGAQTGALGIRSTHELEKAAEVLGVEEVPHDVDRALEGQASGVPGEVQSFPALQNLQVLVAADLASWTDVEVSEYEGGMERQKVGGWVLVVVVVSVLYL